MGTSDRCKILLFILAFFLICLSWYQCVEARGSSQAASKSSNQQHNHRHHAKPATNDDEDDDDDDDDDEGDNDNEEETIEDVDEDKIDTLVDDNDKNLVIVFYDKDSKCPQCRKAVKELEEIDDDLEAAGYIEVVKTDDRKVAEELGVHTFPALVYFRRKNPILYDGSFEDSKDVLRWIRAHDDVATVELDDSNFEDKTDSYSPSEGTLDWFVMFYDSKKIECSAYVAVWESVAHRLRGIVHIGKVDIAESDDVADRFNVDDDDDCPSFFLFRKGKLYRYKETARDVKSFTSFALLRYKDQRGHRVPEPPTMLEELYEDLKEDFEDVVGDYGNVLFAIIGCVGVVFLLGGLVWIVKTVRARSNKDKKES